MKIEKKNTFNTKRTENTKDTDKKILIKIYH